MKKSMKCISFLIITITLALVSASAYMILSASISSKTSNYHLIKKFVETQHEKSLRAARPSRSTEDQTANEPVGVYFCESDINKYSLVPQYFSLNHRPYLKHSPMVPGIYGSSWVSPPPCNTDMSVVISGNII